MAPSAQYELHTMTIRIEIIRRLVASQEPTKSVNFFGTPGIYLFIYLLIYLFIYKGKELKSIAKIAATSILIHIIYIFSQ